MPITRDKVQERAAGVADGSKLVTRKGDASYFLYFALTFCSSSSLSL